MSQRFCGCLQHRVAEAQQPIQYPQHVYVEELDDGTPSGVDLAAHRRRPLDLALPASLTQSRVRGVPDHQRQYQRRFDDEVARVGVIAGQINQALCQPQALVDLS